VDGHPVDVAGAASIGGEIAMPPDDRVRLHDNQRPAPVVPATREGNPKELVARPEAGTFLRTVQGLQLLPEREVLQDQFPMSAERQGQRADEHDEQLQHVVIVAGVYAKIQFGRVLARVTSTRASCTRPAPRSCR
jgi:hypothetical protein